MGGHIVKPSTTHLACNKPGYQASSEEVGTAGVAEGQGSSGKRTLALLHFAFEVPKTVDMISHLKFHRDTLKQEMSHMW